jgi:hypothetical protein
VLITRRSDPIPKHKSGKARIATGGNSAPAMISSRPSYRLDNRHRPRRTKDSGKQ